MPRKVLQFDMFQCNTLTYTILFALPLLTGCGITVTTNDVSTTTPTNEQVARCRNVMYINPEIDITPLGYAIETGMDDVIRFKFVANTDDPSTLFDSAQVDATKFTDQSNPYALHPKSLEK